MEPKWNTNIICITDSAKWDYTQGKETISANSRLIETA